MSHQQARLATNVPAVNLLYVIPWARPQGTEKEGLRRFVMFFLAHTTNRCILTPKPHQLGSTKFMNHDKNTEILKHLRALVLLRLADAENGKRSRKVELLLSRAGFSLKEIAAAVGKK